MSGQADPMARELEDLAQELERMVQHTADMAEEDASTGDLLEDLEERVIRLAARLRGREVLPHTFYHPMPEES